LIRETGNVLQAPIISTINNVPATINISDTITIPQSVVVSSPAGVTTANSFAVFTTFNGLNVLPHINGDNSITMTLSPQLQTLDPQPGGGVRSNTQFLTTTRIVQNGETMVLGGFISKQEVRSERRVPFLSELPLIGLLFRQNSRTVNGFEVLVFVTPTIIEDRSQGTTGTGGVAPAPTP
jgi:type II secretory pathway component GspD/PulD (secretin)